MNAFLGLDRGLYFRVAELLVVNYQGSLRSYLIGNGQDYQLHHSFTFGSHYPQGVNCIEYDTLHSLLLIGGSSKKPDSDVKVSSGTGTAMKHGLTVWRSLSDAPHYTLVTDYEHDLQMVSLTNLTKMRVLFYDSDFSVLEVTIIKQTL